VEKWRWRLDDEEKRQCRQGGSGVGSVTRRRIRWRRGTRAAHRAAPRRACDVSGSGRSIKTAQRWRTSVGRRRFCGEGGSTGMGGAR
jgi:hypothetical protein